MSVGGGCRGEPTLGSGGAMRICGMIGATGLVRTGRGGSGVGCGGGGRLTGTLGSCGGIIVGCTLGMVALGSNRAECGTPCDGGWLSLCGLVSSTGSAAVEKMSASCRTARIWSSPRVLKGDAGAGLRSASASILAASAALSADDVWGMSSSWGKNSTVRATRSARVCVMYVV